MRSRSYDRLLLVIEPEEEHETVTSERLSKRELKAIAKSKRKPSDPADSKSDETELTAGQFCLLYREEKH